MSFYVFFCICLILSGDVVFFSLLVSVLTELSRFAQFPVYKGKPPRHNDYPESRYRYQVWVSYSWNNFLII